MALGIFDYIFGENRFKQGDSGSDPTDYGLLEQSTQPDYLKQGVDYMAKGVPIMWDTLKDVQVLGGTSEPGRVAENYMRRWRGEDIIQPTEPKFISNYRNKVENMPVAPYTGKGDFQGVLGSTEAEKYDGYSGSDLTDYDISGENISNADRFGAQSVLGALEMVNRPIQSGETLSNVAVGGLANLTGVDIDPYYQEIASEMGKELAKDFDSWEAWNKSLYEQPDVPGMVLAGTSYTGLKMMQMYKNNPKFQNAIKESFENAKNPGLSIKDISNNQPTIQMSSEALPSTGKLEGRMIKKLDLDQQYQYETEVNDILGDVIETKLGLTILNDAIAPSNYGGHIGASRQTIYKPETTTNENGDIILTDDFKNKILEASVIKGWIQDQDAVTINFGIRANTPEDVDMAFIDYDRPITNDEMVNFDNILNDLGLDDNVVARVSTPDGIKFVNIGTDNKTFTDALGKIDELVDGQIELMKNNLGEDMNYGYIGGKDYASGQETYKSIGSKIGDTRGDKQGESWWSTDSDFVSIKEKLAEHRQEFLKRNPLPRRTIREIGEESDQFYKKSGQTIKLGDTSPKAQDSIASRMYEETLAVLRGGDKDARGWYTDKYEKSLSILAETMPQLKNPTDKDLFTSILAILSDGTELGKNTELAVKVFNDYQKTGKVNTNIPQGGERSASFRNNLNKLQNLIDEKGLDNAMEYLDGFSTAKDLEKTTGVSIGYLADTELPNTAMFGDKLGLFMANLKGHPDYLTMDRWWNRTFNRLRGQMTVQPTEQSIMKFKEMIGKPNAQRRTIIKEAKKYEKEYRNRGYKNGTPIEKTANNIVKSLAGLRDAPLNKKDRKFQMDVTKQVVDKIKKDTEFKDMTVADLQAILWFAEKRRMKEYGSPTSLAEKDYLDAVKDIQSKGLLDFSE